MTDWDTDVERVLDNIRINSAVLSREHKERYFLLKSRLQYFRLPVIVISSVNSIVSIGFQSYIEQSTISIITCFLALSCSIIGSIELFLSIQKQMEQDLSNSKEYYLLSIEIYKTLQLSRERRAIHAKEYLEKIYSEYCKLVENSDLITKKIQDELMTIEEYKVPVDKVSIKVRQQDTSDTDTES
uniref:SMODS and SLOG-associating 2TM effector domain-containing protein n=1 Tax=viral metagenome TaxID=1070528 RepID=A0A6C0ITP5_9ZZZZ